MPAPSSSFLRAPCASALSSYSLHRPSGSQPGDYVLQSIRVRTVRRTQMVEITTDVQRVVTALGIKTGTCFLYVPHTTAGILINEHADPDVATDAEGAIDRLVPM